ncbi:MAG: hypothetical protein JXK05_13325 [Campylobacterales bacterium]|nr:hypothetical protein [Campylobacterales bacterium]
MHVTISQIKEAPIDTLKAVACLISAMGDGGHTDEHAHLALDLLQNIIRDSVEAIEEAQQLRDGTM